MVIDILKIVWRKKTFVAFFTVFFILFVLIALLAARLTFEAMAVVRIVKLGAPTSGMTHEDSLQDKLAFIETQKRMITSRLVLLQLMDRLPWLLEWAKNAEDPELARELVLKKLQKAVSIQPIRFTDLVEIRVRTNKRSEVAQIANTLVSVYTDWLHAETSKQYRTTTEFLDDRLQLAEKRLSDDEDKIHDYKQKNQVVLLRLEIENGLGNVNRLERQIADVDARIEYLEDIVARIRSEKEPLSVYVGLAENETIKQLSRELDFLEMKIKLSKGYYREDHPKYRELLARRDNLVSRLHDRLVGSFESRALELGVSRSKKLNELAKHRKELYQLREFHLEMEKLERRFHMDEKAYLALLNKYEASKVLTAKKSLVEVLVISPAVPPIKHILPQRKKIFILSAMMGFLLALAIAVFRERFFKELNVHVLKPEFQSSL
jgi:uncharacterized protein involved in exopolysaccharide biosynthesis